MSINYSVLENFWYSVLCYSTSLFIFKYFRILKLLLIIISDKLGHNPVMSSSVSSDEEHEENDTDEVSDLLNIHLATVELLVKLKTE